MEVDSTSGIVEILEREFIKNGQLLRAVILGITSQGKQQHLEIAPFKTYEMTFVPRPYEEFIAEVCKRVSNEGYANCNLPNLMQERYDSDMRKFSMKAQTFADLEEALWEYQENAEYTPQKRESPFGEDWHSIDCRHPAYNPEYRFVAIGKNSLNYLYSLEETGLYMVRPTMKKGKLKLIKIKVAEIKIMAPSV